MTGGIDGSFISSAASSSSESSALNGTSLPFISADSLLPACSTDTDSIVWTAFSAGLLSSVVYFFIPLVLIFLQKGGFLVVMSFILFKRLRSASRSLVACLGATAMCMTLYIIFFLRVASARHFLRLCSRTSKTVRVLVVRFFCCSWLLANATACNNVQVFILL